jgi:hypothetical protein
MYEVTALLAMDPPRPQQSNLQHDARATRYKFRPGDDHKCRVEAPQFKCLKLKNTTRKAPVPSPRQTVPACETPVKKKKKPQRHENKELETIRMYIPYMPCLPACICLTELIKTSDDTKRRENGQKALAATIET